MAEIRKAKLKNGKEEGTFVLIAEYSDKISDSSSVQTAECTKARPHADLIKAFKALDEHLARMTYQLDNTGLPLTDAITCKSFSLKGDDEMQGIVLSGTRKLPNGGSLTLNTPFTRFDDDEKYGLLDELLKDVNYCETEVLAFLFAGKHAQDPQGDLFAQGEDGRPAGTFIVDSKNKDTKE